MLNENSLGAEYSGAFLYFKDKITFKRSPVGKRAEQGDLDSLMLGNFII